MNTMCTFGIKIDLSEFFCDERKLVMLLLDNNWKTVECLQKRIQQLYKVPNILLVNNDGYLLHPSESIDIVRLCSNLKGIIPSENADETIRLHKSKSKSVKREGVHKNDEITIIPGGSHEVVALDNNLSSVTHKSKRKLPWVENTFNTSTPIGNSYQIKRIKGLKDASIQINLTKKQIKQASNEITSTSEVSEQNEIHLLQSISGADGTHELKENEKSVTRHVKKKKYTNSGCAQQNADVSVIVKKPKQQLSLNLTPPADLSNSSKGTKVTQHIYFNEDGTTTDEVIVSSDTVGAVKTMASAATNSTQCNSINTTARFHCSLEDNLDQEQARKFQCKAKKMEKTPEKNSIKIKKIIVIQPTNGKANKHITGCPKEEKLVHNKEINQSEADLTISTLDGDTATMQNNDKVEKDDNKNPNALAKENDQTETTKDKSSTEADGSENSEQCSDDKTVNESKSNGVIPENLEIGNQKAQSIATGLTKANCDANKSISNNNTLCTKSKELEEAKNLLVVETPQKQSPLEMLIDAFKFSGLAATINESSVVSIDDDSDVGEISEIIDLNESDDGF